MSGLAESSPELAAQVLNGFQLKYDSDTSTLSMVSQKTEPEFYVIAAKVLYISDGVELESTKVCLSSVSFDNDIESAVLSETDAARVIGFSLAGRISAVHNGLPDDINYKGRTYLSDVYNNYIYKRKDVYSYDHL